MSAVRARGIQRDLVLMCFVDELHVAYKDTFRTGTHTYIHIAFCRLVTINPI